MTIYDNIKRSVHKKIMQFGFFQLKRATIYEISKRLTKHHKRCTKSFFHTLQTYNIKQYKIMI